jgi:hypothetical protein
VFGLGLGVGGYFGLVALFFIGYVRVNQIFEFVESIGATLTSFSQLALLASGVVNKDVAMARWS